MECNKDEATRAKEIAERKFSAKDILGAKKFALKAQALFPGLEGIPQMLSTIDVYISAENKINGESDWYGILGVDPKAEEDTVRKQYRKLALMLHPDKNKSIGSDGAFKLISQAWTLLSDRAKRTAYDLKRNVNSQQKVKVSSSAPKHSSKPPKIPKNSSAPAPAPPHHHRHHNHHHKAKPNTFWTVCHGCKMQYEYLRVYLNHNLLCPNCHEPFLARETAPPPANGAATGGGGAGKSPGSWSNNYSQKQKKARGSINFQWAPFSKSGTSGSGSSASRAAQAASLVEQAYERVKKEREEAEAERRREKAARRTTSVTGQSQTQSQPNVAKRKIPDDSGGSDDEGASDSGWSFVYEIGVRIRGGGAESPSESKPTGAKSCIDIRGFLMNKARKEIRKNLDRWREKEVVEEKNPPMIIDTNIEEVTKKKRNASESITSIEVLDPDFHDFDSDRTEKSFEPEQIWAMYDSSDGMPRHHAVIHSVISTDPFEVRLGRVGSMSEMGGVGSGLEKACGDFRVERRRFETSTSLSSFSHKVRWSKGSNGSVRIFPRKGQVWALYRNWSTDWDELTESGTVHEYEMVEILGDFDEDLGVITVAPLVKVAGFRAVFHHHLDREKAKTIPRDEMVFRFSHRIPSHVITGREAPDAPKGCRELDPAATPVELLRVIPDVEEKPCEITKEDTEVKE